MDVGDAAMERILDRDEAEIDSALPTGWRRRASSKVGAGQRPRNGGQRLARRPGAEYEPGSPWKTILFVALVIRTCFAGFCHASAGGHPVSTWPRLSGQPRRCSGFPLAREMSNGEVQGEFERSSRARARSAGVWTPSGTVSTRPNVDAHAGLTHSVRGDGDEQRVRRLDRFESHLR